MADERLVRHLRVLTDQAETGAVSAMKLFTIGDPAEVEGEGEVVPILSWVDDNLSRYVVANAASSSWGRVFPALAAPFVMALPNRAVKKKDAVFLITRAGEDRDEANPSGEGRLHFVHLGSSRSLWTTAGRIYIYKLDAVQTRAVLPPRKAPGGP